MQVSGGSLIYGTNHLIKVTNAANCATLHFFILHTVIMDLGYEAIVDKS